ncbi:hypothetical protein [Bordetella sp. LUAb4]|uniref:hypothetical protein n=1 Tax=Bordetella sp. LUAb4 TaxID=2843195 RepID=UPI001E4B49F7|nr:hypothetical protein [Bordetella sp. LUAb4]
MRKHRISRTPLEASNGAFLKKNVFTHSIFVLEGADAVSAGQPMKLQRLVIDGEGAVLDTKVTSLTNPPKYFCVDRRDWLYLLNFPSIENNELVDKLLILDTSFKTQETIKLVPGNGANSISCNPLAERVYVPQAAQDTPTGTVTNVLNLIDANTHKLLPRQPPLDTPNAADGGYMAFGLQAMNYATSVLYLCDAISGTIVRFDTNAEQQITPPMYSTPGGISSIAIQEAGEIYLSRTLDLGVEHFIERWQSVPPYAMKQSVMIEAHVQQVLVDDRYVYGITPERILLYTLGKLEFAGEILLENGTPLLSNTKVCAIHDPVAKQAHLLNTKNEGSELVTVQLYD